PLLVHRMATHSLVAPVAAALLAGLAMAWRGRDVARRAARVAFFGVLSHIVLDYFCSPSISEGVMLFWPFSTERFASTPAVFPLISHHHILSWGNVEAAIGEAAIVSVFLLAAVVRRWLATLEPVGTRLPEAPPESALSPVASKGRE